MCGSPHSPSTYCLASGCLLRALDGLFPGYVANVAATFWTVQGDPVIYKFAVTSFVNIPYSEVHY